MVTLEIFRYRPVGERQMNWTTWGKVKQVLTQLGIYFSVLSMTGIAITAWHTTISPILESHGVTPKLWWPIIILGIPFIILCIFEWKKGMLGFYNSFAKMFYTRDSELRKDIEDLKEGVKQIKEELKDKNQSSDS